MEDVCSALEVTRRGGGVGLGGGAGGGGREVGKEKKTTKV